MGTVEDSREGHCPRESDGGGACVHVFVCKQKWDADLQGCFWGRGPLICSYLPKLFTLLEMVSFVTKVCFSLSQLGDVTFNPGSKQAELYTVVSAAMNVFPFSQGKVHFLSEYLAGPVI